MKDCWIYPPGGDFIYIYICIICINRICCFKQIIYFEEIIYFVIGVFHILVGFFFVFFLGGGPSPLFTYLYIRLFSHPLRWIFNRLTHPFFLKTSCTPMVGSQSRLERRCYCDAVVTNQSEEKRPINPTGFRL